MRRALLQFVAAQKPEPTKPSPLFYQQATSWHKSAYPVSASVMVASAISPVYATIPRPEDAPAMPKPCILCHDDPNAYICTYCGNSPTLRIRNNWKSRFVASPAPSKSPVPAKFPLRSPNLPIRSPVLPSPTCPAKSVQSRHQSVRTVTPIAYKNRFSALAEESLSDTPLNLGFDDHDVIPVAPVWRKRHCISAAGIGKTTQSRSEKDMKAALISVRDLVMPIVDKLLASGPKPEPQLPDVWNENRVPRVLNKPEDDEPCEESLDVDSEPETSHNPEPAQPNNRLLVKLLSPRARVPTRGSESAAGYDLYCAEDKPVIIQPGSWKLVDTGIAIAMDHPATLYAKIASRSGLSVKGLDIGAGVVDADY